MSNALIWTLGGILLMVGTGGVLAFLGIRSAPEGFEDSEGFHAVATPEVATSPVATHETHHDVVSLAV